jgi:azurin
MGISTADMIEDNTAGGFGPFAGQYFVADQGHSKVMRMTLEKVNGQYQGACFPFREGWMSGLLRLRWGNDGSLLGGMTSRGWSSTGKSNFGLQRLVWTGKMPFEIKDIHATKEGFEIEFTKPINRSAAAQTSSYESNSFIYKYQHQYGSPIINQAACSIRSVKVADDGMSVKLTMDGRRQYYIHEIKPVGISAESGEYLLHNVGYYTLNNIPDTSIPSMSHGGHNMNNMTPMPSNKKTKVSTKISVKRLNTMPESWTDGPDLTLVLGTVPGLKFDTESMQVIAGSKIKLVFNNNDDMTHNFVLTAPNAANEVGLAAMNLGLKGPDLEYVPKMSKVLYHTGLLQPDSSETIYFTAPSQPGVYQYVCSYPGHHTVMQGKLIVQ